MEFSDRFKDARFSMQIKKPNYLFILKKIQVKIWKKQYYPIFPHKRYAAHNGLKKNGVNYLQY